MDVVSSIQEMEKVSIELRNRESVIGFVPTMGYLHEGHLSLIDLVREKSDFIILSIFVNPIQFGVGEDLERYPRDLEHDLSLCRERGVDCVFVPTVDQMYPEDASTYVSEESIGTGLCGQARPTHFRGVTTICAKLFNICRPNFVAFGQKDAQQVVVIKRMVRDLHFPLEILVGPTVREHDGLAMSSRNSYLNEKQRVDAQLIRQALFAGQRLVDEKGIRNVDRIKAEVISILSQGRFIRVNYAEIVNRENMFPETEIEPGRSMLVVAVWIDSIRLIDNQPL